MPRQNRGSDSELSYASLIYSSSEITGEGPALVQRDCRSRGSSDDNEDIIYPKNFISEDYRTGGPVLAPLPVESYALPTGARMKALEQDPHRTKICTILNYWGVMIKEYGVMLRQSKDFPEDEQIPTLVIISQKTKQDQCWIKASLEIRDYISTQGLPEVSVEIADSIVFQPLIVSPVERTNTMHSVWGRVCRLILSELDLLDCRILECYRSGYSRKAEENKVTITVTVDRNSTRKWKPFRESIIEILKRFNLVGVAVRITKGLVNRAGQYPNKELPDSIWSPGARLGASMGSNFGLNSSGTFGGYIELKNEKGEWQKFGLTCYHAIQPELKGVSLDTMNSKTPLCTTFRIDY